ncbi:MAG TPA: hypothetical protein VNR39_13770 [Pseudolabrys sp.]|nr:hypothetical protein [Pseudolabrys sp.]
MARKKSTTGKAKDRAISGGSSIDDDLVGKRIRIERATFDAISLMMREQMKDLDEITEEAFRDLLKKYGRTADFREALKMSARQAGRKTEDARPGSKPSDRRKRSRTR